MNQQTDDNPYTEEDLAEILESTRRHPIGSRLTATHATYTVVALRLSGLTTTPILLADNATSGADWEWTGGLDRETRASLTPAAADPDQAAKARALARQKRDLITSYGSADVLWDNPTATAEIRAVLAYGEVDRAWRLAESAQQKAAEERALAIARVAWDAGGNQSAAGRLLGLDQSRVSRAMETAHRLTGGDTA